MFLSIIEIIASWGLWFWRCQMSACVSATKFALRICGNRISIGLWLFHKLLSIFKSCSGSGLLHMGVCVCVCVWPLCQWLVLLTGVKTMTKLRYLIATHAHTHTHKPAHSLIKQSARRARRQPNVNATPGDYFDLQLPHAACCSASTAFNMLQFAESSGKVYAVWQGGRVTGSELPIQLEICASAASYRKNIAYVKCLRLQDTPSLSTILSITAHWAAYAVHATLLQVQYENVQGNQFTSFTSGVAAFCLRGRVCVC